MNHHITMIRAFNLHLKSIGTWWCEKVIYFQLKKKKLYITFQCKVDCQSSCWSNNNLQFLKTKQIVRKMHFEFNPDTCRTWLELGGKKKRNQWLCQKIEWQCWGLWPKNVCLLRVEGESLTRDVSLENNILLILPSYRVLTEIWETWVQYLGWDNPRKRAWQSTPAFLPGQSPCTKGPGGLQSMGSQRVRRDWVTMHSNTGC